MSSTELAGGPIRQSPAALPKPHVQRRSQSSLAPSNVKAPPTPALPLHAVISTFDLFSIGIGPSSSHTVGPMRSVQPAKILETTADIADCRAARIFTHSLPAALIPHIHSLKVSLHGSLAATGMGHMTPHAILLGLMGEDPETVETSRLGKVLDEVKAVGEVELGFDGLKKRVKLDLDQDLVSEDPKSLGGVEAETIQTWHLNPLPAHPNGLRFTLFNEDGDMLATNEYFSVGGGFVVSPNPWVRYCESLIMAKHFR